MEKLIYRNEKIITDYFNEFKSGAVRQLDTKKEYYTSVTLPYIRKYLFDNKISKSFLEFILFKLCTENYIRTFVCDDINKVIFTNYCNYRGYNSESGLREGYIYDTNSMKKYSTLLRSYYCINSKFKKK